MSLKTLCLMRHSQAVAELSEGITKDIEKPLTDAGIHQLEYVRQFIKDHQLKPDLIVCSNAVRTRQTLEWIHEALGATIAIEYTDALYGGDVGGLFDVVSGIDDHYANVWIIGHNPSITDGMRRLLSTLPEDTQQNIINLPARPAQLAVFTSDASSWASFVLGQITLIHTFEPAYNV